MPNKTYWSIAASMIVTIIVTSSIYGQTGHPLTPGGEMSLSGKMYIHAYTGYGDDLEHCFIQDKGDAKRPLYFDAYTDVDIEKYDIYLKLYSFDTKDYVDMKKDKDWYIQKISGNMFTIKIKKDAPPHLGPGPYMALVAISPMDQLDQSKKWYYYPYGTWSPDSSPLDCWYPPYNRLN